MSDDEIRITVHPHGELTTHFGRASKVQLSAPSGTSIRGLLVRLNIPEGDVWLSARNGEKAGPDDVLESDDVLELFSPVAGGAVALSVARSSAL